MEQGQAAAREEKESGLSFEIRKLVARRLFVEKQFEQLQRLLDAMDAKIEKMKKELGA